MARCALVNLSTNQVENLIVADAGDHVDDGFRLIASPPRWVQIGTPWNGRGFVSDGISTPRQIEGMETL